MDEPMKSVDIRQLGTITEIKRGIVTLKGLPTCVVGQLIELGPRARGLVIEFRDDEVSALVLEAGANLMVGQRIAARQVAWRLGVGETLLGRIVTPLGEPLDGQPRPDPETTWPVFQEAPGIMQRAPITRQVPTGITMIDTMIPIGHGQRELIIGDRMTGKTTLAIDTLLNLHGRQVVGVYCLIGHSMKKLRQVTALLNTWGVLQQTVIVAATASQPASLQYLAPYAACAVGEFFMRQGRDVVVIFDDLSKHAWAYRQLSLLLDRPPGREAYPGDMFYVHAQLLERAAQLNSDLGGGSMTFLPICETQQGDVTGYIPSNLIAMTDGQLYLSSDLFYEGVRPAVDLGLSVSRIGNKVQPPALRQVSANLRLEALSHRELKRLVHVAARGSSAAAARIHRGEVLRRILIQAPHAPVPFEEQLMLCYSFQKGWLERLSDEGLTFCEEGIFGKLPGAVQDMLKTGQPLTANVQAALDSALTGVLEPYLIRDEVPHAIPEAV